MGTDVRRFIRTWFPPAMIRLAQQGLDFVRRAPWEYVSDRWCKEDRMRGWNVASIVELHKTNWAGYARSLEGPHPLGLSHESSIRHESVDVRDHNLLVTYGYVIALAAHQKPRLSVLDWGGGMGHYYLVAKALLPQVQIDYTCQDVPLLCQAGREVLPQVRFCDQKDECFGRQYDLAVASSSLWYEENWRLLVDKLVASARPYLYVTRMVFVEQTPSYVVIQRPAAMGYQTEYLCWILNRNEFVNHVLSRGMILVREFLLSNAPRIHKAPEQGEMKGFLFRKLDGNTTAG